MAVNSEVAPAKISFSVAAISPWRSDWKSPVALLSNQFRTRPFFLPRTINSRRLLARLARLNISVTNCGGAEGAKVTCLPAEEGTSWLGEMVGGCPKSEPLKQKIGRAHV